MRETEERELKLTPTDGFRLADLDGVPLQNRDFVSTYFDTPELRLARNNITLRHRSEGGAGLWQLKVPRGAFRIELEVSGTPSRPPSDLLALLTVHLRGSQPVRIARLRTRRKTVRVDGAEIVEDSVAVLDGQRITSRFRELEVELVDAGDESTLRRLEKDLRRAGAEPAEFRPKVYRALDLPSPPDSLPLASDATPDAVLAAALADQHRRLVAHDPGTRLGTDPEDLHQMRVATRRARAFLRAARSLLDPEWGDELRAELGWLGTTLGPARDLDVLSERLERQTARLGEDQGVVRGLLETLARQRRKARAAVVSALSDERYFRLLDRLEDPIRDLPPMDRAPRSPSSGGPSSSARDGHSVGSTTTRATTSSMPRGSGSSAPGTRPSSPRSSWASSASASSRRRRISRTCSVSIRTRSSPRSGFARGRKEGPRRRKSCGSS